MASPKKKRPRLDIPLPLELAFPYLSATEDLPRLALVSKATLAAVQSSYLERIRSPIVTKSTSKTSSSSSSSSDGRPKIDREYTHTNAPKCYRTPWWAVKEWEDQAWYHQPRAIEVHEDGSWTFEDEQDDVVVANHEGYEYKISTPPFTKNFKWTIPTSHQSMFEDVEMVHFSKASDGIILIIFCRWTDRGPDLFNDENTRKQLFAALYKLPTTTSAISTKSSASTANDASVLSPFYFESLTERKDRNNYGSIDDIYFGHAVRSRNGHVVAVVTALPLGNEDNLDNAEPRATAEVTIFDIDIDKTSMSKRDIAPIEIAMGARTHDSNLSMTLTNCGELLSIQTTADFDDPGCWGMYDIRSERSQEIIFKVAEFGNSASDAFEGHAFTPDNELWLQLPEQNDPSVYFLEDPAILPEWLVPKMIVVERASKEDIPRFLSP